MNILIIHAHTANRGDEAAVHAMVDELLAVHPDAKITICINGSTFYPNLPTSVTQIGRMPKLHTKLGLLDFLLLYHSHGHVCFRADTRRFKKLIAQADLVLHAPGGPSIGDIYQSVEKLYLYRLDLVRMMGKKYMFYAPSMGPFNNDIHTTLRKRVISSAAKVILRDPISVSYVQNFLPNVPVAQALDSALQHDIDVAVNKAKLEEYRNLYEFLSNHDRVIGITVTDLKWHPKHGKTDLPLRIPKVFNAFVKHLTSVGYGVVFIPQLYGAGDDTTLMRSFMTDDTFMVAANDEKYDTYFQQYLIGQLYAVVGMRYHSNIFSAKMGTPFISVSYEQKMKGFMESINLEEYCVDIDHLSLEILEDKFDKLQDEHAHLAKHLLLKHDEMKNKSYTTTKAALELLGDK